MPKKYLPTNQMWDDDVDGFEDFLKGKGILMCHVWGYREDEMQDAWQEATKQATEKERDRIVGMVRREENKQQDYHIKLPLTLLRKRIEKGSP